ncbi:MAG TPA: hypothetical protein VFS21_34310 [Roseiflexaceae bacterium]|nr:hypothetical protein [Roseiflexaceae bacterium]
MTYRFGLPQRVLVWCLVALLLVTSTAQPAASQEQPAAPQDTGEIGGVIVPGGIETYTPPSSQTETAAPTTTDGSSTPDNSAAPDAAPEPSATIIADSSITANPAPQVQGAIRLDVTLPPTVKADEDLVYTYLYTNTTSTVYSNLVLQTTWSNFSTNFNGEWQFCRNTAPSPNCEVASTTNATITKLTTCPNNLEGFCYEIGSIKGNEAGRFSVRLHTATWSYPRSNEVPKRPAGSARLYTDTTKGQMSDDTASTLIIGPALVVSVTTDTSKVIFPTKGTASDADTAEFVLTVGNATGSGDTSNGQPRADARIATQVRLSQYIPVGAVIISTTPQATIDTTNKRIYWDISSLAVGATSGQYRVKYRKDDVPQDCFVLLSRLSTATSNEYPIDPGTTQRHFVVGPEMPVRVAPTLEIFSIQRSPDPITYGDQGEITIVVRNYWRNQATAKLNYSLQSNVKYLANSAVPAAATQPDPAQFGGMVSWNFTIPGTTDRLQPKELTFKLRATAGFQPQIMHGTAQIVVTDTATPSACVLRIDGGLAVIPRLVVRKYTDSTNGTFEGRFVVEQGEEFPYIIEVQNNANSDAIGLSLTDIFPKNDSAAFTYKIGSATIAPSIVNNTTPGGSLIWNGLKVPAKSKLVIRYTLVVSGIDYYTYCNRVEAKLNEEHIIYNSIEVCVKVNPQIRITKNVISPTPPSDGSMPIVQPGQEVTYKLTLTNLENKLYRFGIGDRVFDMDYVSTVSGYDTNPTLTADRKILRYRVEDLSPGEMIEVVLKTRIPNVCENREYENFAFFHNSDGDIIPIPHQNPRVRVNCGKLRYDSLAFRDITNLQSRVPMAVWIRNEDGKAAANVVARSVLPLGFTYEALSADSAVREAPTQTKRADDRIELKWTVPSIPANTEIQIRFVARAAPVISDSFFTWATVDGGTCAHNCVSDTDGKTYSRRQLQVRALITMEPKLNTTACAQPGDTRTYTLSILNTDNIDYTGTSVVVELPLGLNFSRVLTGTGQPATVTDNNGVTSVVWANQRIRAKPDNVFATQVTFQLELKVGNVWGPMDTKVQTSSLDGAIPRKENVTDPTVPVCPATPSVAKTAAKPTMDIGSKMLYRISLANPTNQAINNVVVEDTLPAGMEFDSMSPSGQPTPKFQNGKLTWTVNVPAGTSTAPGVVILTYLTKLKSNASVGSKHTNTVRVTSTPAMQTTVKGQSVVSATVTAVRIRYFFLPVVAK